MLYLLVSNLPKHSIGLRLIFISLSDVRVLLSVLASIFIPFRVTLYDYQALCWVYSESSDSGHTLLDVSIALYTLFSQRDLCALKIHL